MIEMDERVDRVLRDKLERDDYEMVIKMLEAMEDSPRNVKDSLRKILEGES